MIVIVIVTVIVKCNFLTIIHIALGEIWSTNLERSVAKKCLGNNNIMYFYYLFITKYFINFLVNTVFSFKSVCFA